MKLVKACIAMAAFAAIFVVPSIASAGPTLTHPTGVSAPAGTLIQGTNVAHANTKAHTLMTLSNGAVTCNTATLTGSIETNQNGHLAGNITTAEFRGREGDLHGPDCSSPLGNITVTPNHTTNPCHEPVAGQKHCSLPWCITASGNENTFTVRGSECSKPATPITFTMHTPVGACSYQKAVVTGTYTTHPNPALLTIFEQEFTKITGSVFCPPSGKLDMAFTLETDPPVGGGSPTDVYIDKV